MSPEQATGEPTGAASDIYAVGCLAYELITGDPPFLGPPAKVLRAHVNEAVPPPSTRMREAMIPPALDALVLRCLAKEPDDRYPSAAELRHDLLKVRALLHSIGAELARVGRRRRERSPSQEKMKEGWQRLGGRLPEVLLPPGPEPVMPRRRREPTGVRESSSVDPERTRRAFHGALRELALALVQAALASEETNRDLERLLLLQEEVTTLTGTIALTEQNFDRIRFEYGQREERLRHAILDLSMERAQLQGQAEAEPARVEDLRQQVADLTFQIGTLDESCRSVRAERDEEIQTLDRQVKALRAEKLRREEEAAQIYLALQERVEARRPNATEGELPELYARLDALRAELDAARNAPAD